MPTNVAILLSGAALLTALFIPLTLFKADESGLNAAVAGIGLVILSILRGGVLIFAMMGVAREANVGIAIAAVILMEIASCVLHHAAAGAYDSIPHQYGCIAVATLFPVLVIFAGYLLGSNHAFAPKVLWAATIIPVVAGTLAFTASERSQAARTQDRTDSFEKRRAERMAELKAVPADAGVEPLLPFTLPSEAGDVRTLAEQRIIAADNAVEQLKAALDGPNREAARLIIKDVERTIYRNKKEAEFNAIPPSAVLAAVLSFYSPGEDDLIRGFVEDRLRDTPDTEQQLVKALAGPHPLEAIDLLRTVQYRDVQKYRLEPSSYDAVFAAAAKIVARLNAADRPPEPQVEVLGKTIGLMAERCGEEALKKNRQELMAVYQMSRRAEKEYGYHAHYKDLERALGLQ